MSTFEEKEKEKERENDFQSLCMRRAVELSEQSVLQGTGPFGAVIADEKTRTVIAECHNQVTAYNDPTAHAEVNAIRLACHKLQCHELVGYSLFTSCEPCPMCLSAALWAHVDKIYYKNTRQDAANSGFDDEYLYVEVSKAPQERITPCVNMHDKDIGIDPLKAFKMWNLLEYKKLY
jgi:tRNA(Arg) A34 adenosine deaminase TadA